MPDSPATAVRYAELHARSNFTFLTGASHPEELVESAHALGLSALAITDVNTLAGVVRAHVEAKTRGLPLIIGSEVQFQAGPRAVLLAMTRQGYANLSHLLTVGRRRAPKGECFLNEDDLLAGWYDGMLAVLLPPDPRDRLQPGVGDAQGAAPLTAERLGAWREVFGPASGDRLHLGLSRHLHAGDVARTQQLAAMAAAAGVPVVAVNSVEMHHRSRKALHDVVACIRAKTTLDAAGWHLLPNAEAALKPPAQMARIFHDLPHAVDRAAELADRIVAAGFSLDQLRFEYPDEYVPPGQTPSQYLRQLTMEGAARRYPESAGGVPEKVRRMVEYELALIDELRYEPYFLTIYDVVRHARELDILCQGRGSAANSAVCFCLGITSVDPATSDMLFERFISRERNEPPDIDVDFEHERREEVLQYVYNKYGRDRAAMVCEVIRYRGRSALREVGKALGLSLDQVDRLAKLRHWQDKGAPGAQELRKAGIDVRDRRVQLTIELAQEIAHFPRHLSIHVGGFVITRGPISDLVPVENAAMADRTVIQWDKDDAEALGLLKVDCLALGMLTAVRKCFQLVKETTGRDLTMATIPPDDPPTYSMIQSADTVGVFQIESRGQMSMLVRLKPANFYDLVIEVAIVRPGPIQGGMVHPYLRRRKGLEEVDYPMPALESVLRRTLGVPLFQEQCMQLAVVGAGFTPGEADGLRRAMAAWRKRGEIHKLKQKLVDGMLDRGLPMEFAVRVVDQISGFGEYGFPESHAASFALIAYVSCYLKAHFPAHFIGSVINSQPMGFYSVGSLVQDLTRHGIEVRPVDVAISEYDCTIELADPTADSSWSDDGMSGRTDFDDADGEMSAESGKNGGESPGSTPLSLPAHTPWRAAQTPAATHSLLGQDGRFDTVAYQVEGEWTGGEPGVTHRTRLSAKTPAMSTTSSPFPQAPAAFSRAFALRLGFRAVHGFSREIGDALVAARKQRPFESVADVARRGGLNKLLIGRLADAGAFNSLRDQRRDAVWDATWDHGMDAVEPLFAALDAPDEKPALRPYTDAEIVSADYQHTGLSLHAHPMQLLRDHPHLRGTVTTAGIRAARDGITLTVAGLVQTRQRPSTAKGVTFITLEDEFGTCQLIVWQSVFERHRAEVYGGHALVATGKVQSEDNVVNLIVTRLRTLDAVLEAADIPTRSRDFH